MKKSLHILIGVLFIVFAFFIINSSAGEPKSKPLLPDIPKNWTKIDPNAIYPDFEYNGLKPGCAACPGCNPQFYFFVKGGSVNNLVVYFQGGGACWDSMNCLYFPTY